MEQVDRAENTMERGLTTARAVQKAIDGSEPDWKALAKMDDYIDLVDSIGHIDRLLATDEFWSQLQLTSKVALFRKDHLQADVDKHINGVGSEISGYCTKIGVLTRTSNAMHKCRTGIKG